MLSTPAVLAHGTFTVKWLDVDTPVSYKIYNTYETHATFTAHAREYTFKMLKWKKTDSKTKDAVLSFNKFAQFALEAFAEDTTVFGTYSIGENEVPAYNWGPTEIVTLLKYSMREVFKCANQIAQAYQSSVLEYAIYHREYSSYKAPANYAQYIHLVACHALVHANYLGPLVEPQVVNYADAVPAFRGDKSIKSILDESERENGKNDS